jgi:hypothetical protein
MAMMQMGVAMLHMAQKTHGRLAWKDLFTEAEALADQGFAVTPRLAALAARSVAWGRQPDATAYFTKPDGQVIQAGDIPAGTDANGMTVFGFRRITTWALWGGVAQAIGIGMGCRSARTHPMKHVMSMTASSSSSRVDCARQGEAMRRRSEPLSRFYI